MDNFQKCFQWIFYTIIVAIGITFILGKEYGIGFGIIFGGCLGNYIAFKYKEKVSPRPPSKRKDYLRK